jgi:hypothetical protein
MFIKSPGFLPLVIRIFKILIVFVNLGHENIHMAKDEIAWTFGDLFHNIGSWALAMRYSHGQGSDSPSIWEYFP